MNWERGSYGAYVSVGGGGSCDVDSCDAELKLGDGEEEEETEDKADFSGGLCFLITIPFTSLRRIFIAGCGAY